MHRVHKAPRLGHFSIHKPEVYGQGQVLGLRMHTAAPGEHAEANRCFPILSQFVHQLNTFHMIQELFLFSESICCLQDD